MLDTVRKLGVIIALAGLGPAFAGEEEIEISGFGTVGVVVPDGWTSGVVPDEQNGRRVMRILAPDGERISLGLMIGAMSGGVTMGEARASVAERLNPLLSESLEDKIYALELKSPRGNGAYGRITDKDLPEGTEVPTGEWRHMTFGVYSLANYVVILEIYSDTLRSPAYKQALAVVTDGIYEK